MGFTKGTKVQIVSDNENYDDYRGKTLKIKKVYHNDKEHPYYDMGVFPELLFDLTDDEVKDIPFSLYEYEIEEA
jgi:hypothetical protein